MRVVFNTLMILSICFGLSKFAGADDIVTLEPPEGTTIPVNPPPGTIMYTMLLEPVENQVDSATGFWAFVHDLTYDHWDSTNSQGPTASAGQAYVNNEAGILNLVGLFSAYHVGGAGLTQYVINPTVAGQVQIGLDTWSDYAADIESGSTADGIWLRINPPVSSNYPTPSHYVLQSILIANSTGMGWCESIGSSAARAEELRARVISDGSQTFAFYYDFDSEGGEETVVDMGYGTGLTVINREEMVGTQVIASSSGIIYMGGGWSGSGVDYTNMPSFSGSVALKVDAYDD